MEEKGDNIIILKISLDMEDFRPTSTIFLGDHLRFG